MPVGAPLAGVERLPPRCVVKGCKFLRGQKELNPEGPLPRRGRLGSLDMGGLDVEGLNVEGLKDLDPEKFAGRMDFHKGELAGRGVPVFFENLSINA